MASCKALDVGLMSARGIVKARVTFRDPPIDLEVPVCTTLLEAAALAGAPLGMHCGGVCACASCHVRIEYGAEHLSALEEKEEDALDGVFDVRPSSRLGCQARIVSAGDIVVRITEESLDTWMREHPRRKSK
ncbi:MAG TPA: 2Fe-2S iron-sulfur cluster-binding protein [Polyangiaceae bacterium]